MISAPLPCFVDPIERLSLISPQSPSSICPDWVLRKALLEIVPFVVANLHPSVSRHFRSALIYLDLLQIIQLSPNLDSALC